MRSRGCLDHRLRRSEAVLLGLGIEAFLTYGVSLGFAPQSRANARMRANFMVVLNLDQPFNRDPLGSDFELWAERTIEKRSAEGRG